jgi:hypothetical protein
MLANMSTKNATEVRICAVCGLKFETPRHWQKFCGDTCSTIFHKKGKSVGENEYKKCENCGEVYKPLRYWQRYCGQSCQNSYLSRMRERRKALRELPKCVKCGLIFSPTREWQMKEGVCSEECRSEENKGKEQRIVVEDEDFQKLLGEKTPPKA